uniref:Uncharacterized protein n=1 Tax=Anguilla anguilla TaxID=7936 RepID=A0A0E9XS01_ANGAN
MNLKQRVMLIYTTAYFWEISPNPFLLLCKIFIQIFYNQFLRHFYNFANVRQQINVCECVVFFSFANVAKINIYNLTIAAISLNIITAGLQGR